MNKTPAAELAAQATPRTDALVAKAVGPYSVTGWIGEITDHAKLLERERALLLAKVRAYLGAMDALEEERRSPPSNDVFGYCDLLDRRKAAESALRAVVDEMEGT